ncbi:MAG: hypothetical protein H7X88_01825 [Gloeobacteraceae cyanobacterium ES-bin-316]|nr:hypothetical protein [Ferruginibacter sp.]
MPRTTKNKEMEKWLNDTKINLFEIETHTFKATFGFNSKMTLDEVEQWCAIHHTGGRVSPLKILVYQIVM